jgi:hypothetical protein
MINEDIEVATPLVRPAIISDDLEPLRLIGKSDTLLANFENPSYRVLPSTLHSRKTH